MISRVLPGAVPTFGWVSGMGCGLRNLALEDVADSTKQASDLIEAELSGAHQW